MNYVAFISSPNLHLTHSILREKLLELLSTAQPFEET